MENNPKIFLSYSHDNLDFSNKVLAFSSRLRSEGIDTILDQYEESPPEGWPRWMEKSIEQSEFVLLISSEGYLGKAKDLSTHSFGRGVKWENNLIYQHLYNGGSINNKFIPVVFTDKDVDFIPTPLQGSTFYNVEKTDSYNSLYWRLRGIKKTEKPELGTLRPLAVKERKSLFVKTPIDLEAWNNAGWRGGAFFMDPSGASIPCFMLPFTSEKYAKKIFADWIQIYGKEDTNDEIRISIIEGDIPGEEKGYSIHISPNIDQVAKRMESSGFPVDESLIMSISRIQRAIPKDNFQMLNQFKAQYNMHKKYYLAPCTFNESTGQVIPHLSYKLLKHRIEFRHVSDIGEHDLDCAVIFKNKPWQPLG